MPQWSTMITGLPAVGDWAEVASELIGSSSLISASGPTYGLAPEGLTTAQCLPVALDSSFHH